MGAPAGGSPDGTASAEDAPAEDALVGERPSGGGPAGNVPIMYLLGIRPSAGELVGFSSFKPVLFCLLLNLSGFMLLNSTHIFVVCYLSEIKCCFSNCDAVNRISSIIK